MLMHHMHQYHIKTTYISNLEMLKTVNETFKGSIAKNLIKISSLKQLKGCFFLKKRNVPWQAKLTDGFAF